MKSITDTPVVLDHTDGIPSSPHDLSNSHIQEQINKLKTEIDLLLSGDKTPPSDIEEVLIRLQRAEKSAHEGNPKAWYELARAKLVLHPKGDMSISELAEGDVFILRQELYKVWRELNDVQRQLKHVNTTNAADWLNWGEQALEKDPPQRARAMSCIMRARYSLAKAQEFSEWSKWGYFAIILESIYLLGLPITIVLYSNSIGRPSIDLMLSTMLQVPFYIFVWGFLGGVSWCIYSAAYWSKRRLFDKHYLVWYLAHPWISAVLGGAVSLLFLGSLASFSLGKFDPSAQPSSSALSLVSFVAGFSTNVIWKLLDKTVRNLFGEKGSTRTIHEDAHENVLQSVDN